MYPTTNKSRMPSAHSADADELLDVISMPLLGDMAAWSGVPAGNDDPLDPWPSTSAVYRVARARRAALTAGIVREGLRAARDLIRRGWERYRRHRDTRLVYDALSALDDRTLRDLGFHRCEILSVAAETAGGAAPTRRRVLLRKPD
jgi:uncharacterized protein YjiS (DUF1127 family)